MVKDLQQKYSHHGQKNTHHGLKLKKSRNDEYARSFKIYTTTQHISINLYVDKFIDFDILRLESK